MYAGYYCGWRVEIRNVARPFCSADYILRIPYADCMLLGTNFLTFVQCIALIIALWHSMRAQQSLLKYICFHLVQQSQSWDDNRVSWLCCRLVIDHNNIGSLLMLDRVAVQNSALGFAEILLRQCWYFRRRTMLMFMFVVEPYSCCPAPVCGTNNLALLH